MFISGFKSGLGLGIVGTHTYCDKQPTSCWNCFGYLKSRKLRHSIKTWALFLQPYWSQRWSHTKKCWFLTFAQTLSGLKAKKNEKIICFMYMSGMPGFHDFKTVFRIFKFHRKVGCSSQYVCLPTIQNPKPLLKHNTTKVAPL